MMGTEKRQILVVDDVELNRAILAELFQDSYEVLEAENGCQALELLEAHHDAILIVLLDIIMPVMDGFEMLQNMAHRTWKEEIPVVLITSENSDNALLKGYELGVSDIINKPFNPNIVKRRVDNTIELYLHKRHLEALVRQQVETLEKQTLKLNRFNEFIIDTLSTVVEFRSCESGTHIRRVREITRLLLESLSFRYPEYDLPHGAIDKMVSAASMHDIGKIAIPDAVLKFLTDKKDLGIHSEMFSDGVVDLAEAGVGSIIWATGYAVDFGWLQVDAFDRDGKPRHQRGVSSEPGVYFIGLPWLSRRGSSFIWGVWHDARHVADHIAIQRKYLAYRDAAQRQEQDRASQAPQTSLQEVS